MATTCVTEMGTLRQSAAGGWARRVLLGLAAAAVFLTAGDRGRATSINCGIDPLEVLKLQVKHNVLIFFDTSGSMMWPPIIAPGRANYAVSGDDPESRMWQAKQAMREVAQEYSGRINFGLITFPNANDIKPLNRSNDNTGETASWLGGGSADGPFVYVSNDPAARRFYWDPDDDNLEEPYATPVAVNETDTIRTCSALITTSGGSCILAATSAFVCRTGTTATPFDDAAPTPPGFGAIAPGDVITVDRGAGVFESAQVTVVNSNRCVTVATPMNWSGGPFTFVWSKTRQALGYFGNMGPHTLPANWDGNGPNDRIDIFRSFGNIGDYAVPYPYISEAWDMTPTGVIATWPGSDPATFPSGNTAPGFNQWRKPLCNPLSGECKYYLHSRVFRSGMRYTWNLSQTPPISPANRLVSVANTTCAPVPAAPAGQELVDQRDLNRPCIEFVDVANPGEVATFYYSSAFFQQQGGSGCSGTPNNITNVSDCVTNNVPIVVNSMELGLPLDPAAPTPDTKLMGLPAANQNPAPNMMTGVTTGITNPVPALSGVRPFANTPIAHGLQAVRTGGPYFPPIPPLPPGVVQKNFVLVLTDGNNNCNNNSPDPAAEARLLFNMPPGRNQAQTLLVAYAPDAGIDEANFIARGGSGGVLSGCPAGYQPANCSGCSFTCYTCPVGSTTCLDAFRATTVQDLKNQLRAALDVIQSAGEFSATQSIVGTVYELAPTPLDPLTRYNSRVNILYQSTFDVSGWKGKFKAFKNDGTFAPVPFAANPSGRWEAGETLYEQVVRRMQTSAGAAGVNRFTFAELHAGATMANIGTSGAMIRRRIFTSPGHGRFVRTTDLQFDNALPGSTNVVALWPPNPAGVDPTVVDPGAAAGPLDDALGIGAGSLPTPLTYNDLQVRFGACDRSTAAGGPLPAACNFAVDPVLALATARREARQVILAYTAGAKVRRVGADNKPDRTPAGELVFTSRDWILADSTVATPAVVTPPLRFTPQVHAKEWVLYRDGRRDANKRGIDVDIPRGFGLRNPDFDDPSPAGLTNLKPVATVVYIGANDGLAHAFSARTSEEMWAFAPYDQLSTLARLVSGQVTEPHIYGVASAMRVADIFVPGSFCLRTPGVPTPNSAAACKASGGVFFDGRWRTMLLFGRGPGGKYYTAVDVTSPGPFTLAGLNTSLPWIMWSRGNPDTVDGKPAGGGNEIRPVDTAAYSTMGETWSVPAVGNVRFRDLDFDGLADDPEWRCFMGSGCTDTPSEGSTFYVADALTGDLIASQDVGDGPAATAVANIPDNQLVAGAAAWNSFQLDQPGVGVRGADMVTRVYIPDVKGRIFKIDPVTGTSGTLADFGILQPIGNPVALLKLTQAGAFNGDFVFAESGNDNRVHKFPMASPPFKMFGLKDIGGDSDVTTPAVTIPGSSFPRDFPTPFRGTVQPATAFNAAGNGRVFFAGTALVDGGASCLFRFDTLLFAFGALSGNAVYDFNGGGVDDSALVQGVKTTGLQVVGGQVLLSDSGKVGSAPAPPPVPAATPAPVPPSPPWVNVLRLTPDTAVCRP